MRKYSKYNLFLDDIRMPHDTYLYTKKSVYDELDWQVKRSYNEFVECITQNGLPELISFDHDLADEHYNPAMYESQEEYEIYTSVFKEKTGYDCALWLVDHCIDYELPLPAFLCHSMNPVGHEKILSILNNFKKHQNLS